VFCKRYISDDDLSREIETVFKFLIRKIINSGYECDLQLRDNYFNLYYRGNNLANVSYCQGGNGYEIKIHHKFVDDEMKKMFRHREQRRYLIFMIPQKQLRTFFSNRYLNKMCQKIREIYFQEEVTFEQMIMTDNVNREDFIIIDRQVVKSRMRIDLLALVKKEGADYQFCVIEVSPFGENHQEQGRQSVLTRRHQVRLDHLLRQLQLSTRQQVYSHPHPRAQMRGKLHLALIPYQCLSISNNMVRQVSMLLYQGPKRRLHQDLSICYCVPL
jgi:hypothetical protein